MQFQILFLYFFIYSVLGWIAEIFYCRLCSGRFTNRGFLNGPYCPIYGFGAVIIIFFLEPFKYNAILVFILGMILTSLLEYVTSFLMEKIFNAKWWDYSNMKFNINGRICLLNSTEFAILGLIITYIIHPQIVKIIGLIKTNYLNTLSEILLCILVLDFTVTLYTILNLKAKLKQLKLITDEIIENKRNKLQNIDINKSLEKIKDDIVLKTTVFHNRIIEAFPNIEFKKQNQQLTELKLKLYKKLKNKINNHKK